MTDIPYRSGDFVWCAFPQRENPARPGPMHLTYVLATTGRASVLAAYKTSRLSTETAAPARGRFKFSRDQALELGQQRAFELNLQRLAFVPMTAVWFPGLNQPDKGIQSHAPKRLQQQIWQAAEVILTRHDELVERLGPLWPTTRH
nr:hypothetical protein [uncultured Rhodopila sp.]